MSANKDFDDQRWYNESYNRLIPTKKAYERNFPEMGEFIIVHSPHLNMLTVISKKQWKKQQEGVGNIIHDKLELK